MQDKFAREQIEKIHENFKYTTGLDLGLRGDGWVTLEDKVDAILSYLGIKVYIGDRTNIVESANAPLAHLTNKK